MYLKIVKPFWDVVSAFIGLIVLSPLFLVVAIFIKMESKGPVFFRQVRNGQFTKPFNIYKFRTMVVGNQMKVREDGTVITEKNDARITKVGNFLRGGLDELPQLINIVKGEMSVVGPRPDLPMHLESTTEAQRVRYNAKPGITNLPAVCGRNDLPLEVRNNLDIYYVNHRSFFLDLKIIWFTLMLPFNVKAPINQEIKNIINA